MKILVFDGNSIINRAFYAIRLLSNSKGLYTNGIYGFLSVLFKELEAEKPDAVVSAFDLKGPTFRHERFEGYKAQRKPMPPELAEQLPVLKEILLKLGVTCLEKEGYEADDIIGTLADRCERGGDECVIITGDKDDLQLVSDKTVCKLTVTRAGKTESTAYTPELFYNEYGFTPEKMVDLKALWGDPSDNIPGVPGIGQKTGGELVRRFGTVEQIYANIDSPEIKDSVRAKLIDGRESAFLSKELATIMRDVPIELSRETIIAAEPEYDGLLELFERLEFKSFAERIRPLAGKKTAAAKPVKETKRVSLSSMDELDGALGRAGRIYISRDESGLFFYNEEAEVLYELSHIAFGGEYFAAVKRLLCGSVGKTVHDIKGLLSHFNTDGFHESSFVFDTMLAAYLINPAASSYDPAGLVFEFLGRTAGGAGDIAVCLPELERALRRRLEEDGMKTLYEQIEHPLCFVLLDMERRGIELDTGALLSFGEKLRADLEKTAAEVYELAGEEFNINSPKQLSEILFSKLSLPHGKKSKTGGFKTDADTLEALAEYPIVGLVLKYRQLSKLLFTYVDGFLKKVDGGDGRVHTTFNQTVTITGRISSEEPNMQNIPVRTELGRELRRMFVAREGFLLLDADYSQIELRVLADMAKDENMLAAFHNSEDIHTATAASVFGVPPESVTSEMRRSAKAVNFGIVYGISAFSLARDIGVSVHEAKLYIDAYFEKYSGVKEYLDRTVAAARENGYVTTALGRRRALPELRSSNFNLRSFGERAAMNTPIQGTAADIIKLAMVRVSRRLKAEGLKAGLVLQVHDELIIEAPIEEAELAGRILKEEMSGAAGMGLPLPVDVGVGKSWYDAK